MKSLTRFSAALLMLAGLAAGLRADESTLETYLDRSLRFIPNDVSLTLSQEIRYNDNIDEARRSDRSGSFISNTAAKASITRTIDKFTYGLEGGVSYEHYFHKRKNDDGKGFSYSFAPIALGSFDFDRIGAMLSFQSSYRNEEVDASDTTTTMVARNTVKLALQREFTGKTGIVVTGDYTNVHYSKSEFKDLNYQNYGVVAAPYFNYSPKTKLGMTFGAERRSYNHSSKTDHSNYNKYKVGVYGNYAATDRSRLFAEGGFTKIDYQDGSLASKDDSSDKWYDYITVGAAYQAFEDLSFLLRLSRDITDSFGANAHGIRVTYRGALTATWNITGKLDFVPGVMASYNDERTSDDDFYEFMLDFLLRYNFNAHWNFYAGYNIEHNRFKHNDEKNFVENELRVGATWKY